MKIRHLSFKRALACFVLALGAAAQWAPANAQGAPSQQVLDRVFTYDTRAVLNMATGNANDSVDYTNLGLNASPIVTCALTPADGLYCLDGRALRRWANPLAPPVPGVPLMPGDELFKCTDANLGFDALVPLCTGMTVDKSGVIWLSGKKKLPKNWPNRPWWISEQAWIALQTWFSPYSVVKVTKKGSAPCAAGQPFGRNSAYCATEAYSGRFLVTRLSAVDGDAASNFKPCGSCSAETGVLGVEDFRNVVFFSSNPAVVAPRQITGGWNSTLKFGEVFDDVSFLVFNGQSSVLATTNSGRVLAKNTAQGGLATEVFNIPAKRAPGSLKCSTAATQFGIRSAATSAIVFVTDRQYCQVPALRPVATTLGNFKLENLPRVGGGNFTLFTKVTGFEAFPIIGLTVAPGIGVDLGDCNLDCALVNAAGGESAAASLLQVQVVDKTKAGATIFHLKDIPDCRYAEFFPTTVDGNAKRQLCATTPGVVVNPQGTGPFPPAAQMLNATKLLSGDVLRAFQTSGVTLPDLLISRQYRGQKENNYLFGALFVIPAPGVQYKSVFIGDYDVLALQGKTPLPPGADDPRCKVLVTNPQLSDLLKWNVTTSVSETYVSIGGKYIDSVTNVDCGSIRGSYSRLSLLPYDLELTPDTYAPVALWPFSAKLTKDNDAVFGRLVESLIDDLGYVFKELACKPVDTAGKIPLPANVCASNSATRDHLYWLEYKFDRCMVGAFTPKHIDAALPSSLRNRPYCDLTMVRLGMLQSSLPVRTATDPVNDVANRLGELHSRIDILRHVYTTRFLPSIPDRGFCKELQVCSYNTQ